MVTRSKGKVMQNVCHPKLVPKRICLFLICRCLPSTGGGMRTCAVANAMTWLRWLKLKIMCIGTSIFSSHTLSDRPRHATPCHTSDNSKIIQKAVKGSMLLHTASVSSFLTLTSLTELFLRVFPGETATACYSNVVWMCLENDQSCRSTSAWLRWPASLQGVGPSSCTT